MVRAALASKARIGQGPVPLATWVPALSVVAGSLLATLPVVSQAGWWPDFGFVILIAWRLLRADGFPAWWAAPLGLANDLITGLPTGFSVSMWTASIIALDLVDRRTMWRDYWVEWALAAILILAYESAEWWIAGLMGAPLPFRLMVPPLLISILTFPLAAWAVSRIDRWRLGR